MILSNYAGAQNVSLGDFTLRLTKAAPPDAAFRAIWLGYIRAVGDRPGLLTINGSTVITGADQDTGDAENPKIAIQIDQDETSPDPLSRVRGFTVTDGFGYALVIAGTNGHFDLTDNLLGSNGILKGGTGQTFYEELNRDLTGMPL